LQNNIDLATAAALRHMLFVT